MRCPRCGNENPGNNRFCGQCGATLLAAVPAAPTERATSVSTDASPAPAASASHPPVSERPPASTQVSDDRPAIAGPSFLGLSDPSPPRRRGNLSIDPHSHSGNLDYLLDDSEEPPSGGAGKIFVILLAVALAVGFGYLRFKTHGFPWATAGAAKPPVSEQAPNDANANSPPPTSAPSNTPEAQPSASNPPVAPVAQPPAAANPSHDHDNAAATPSGSTSKSSPPADSASPEKPAETADSSTGAPNSDNTAKADKAGKSDDANSVDNDEPAASAPPETAAKPKPTAKPRAATMRVDRVGEAQKYIYGKGVPQDCDRGLRLLKPLANQADPKAMIELGALYSAGLCTPRDLPTAYRWFAMALRKDPSNESVQTDLQKLWGEMTQPERQLAIKLTQ